MGLVVADPAGGMDAETLQGVRHSVRSAGGGGWECPRALGFQEGAGVLAGQLGLARRVDCGGVDHGPAAAGGPRGGGGRAELR